MTAPRWTDKDTAQLARPTSMQPDPFTWDLRTRAAKHIKAQAAEIERLRAVCAEVAGELRGHEEQARETGCLYSANRMGAIADRLDKEAGGQVSGGTGRVLHCPACGELTEFFVGEDPRNPCGACLPAYRMGREDFRQEVIAGLGCEFEEAKARAEVSDGTARELFAHGATLCEMMLVEARSGEWPTPKAPRTFPKPPSGGEGGGK